MLIRIIDFHFIVIDDRFRSNLIGDYFFQFNDDLVLVLYYLEDVIVYHEQIHSNSDKT